MCKNCNKMCSKISYALLVAVLSSISSLKIENCSNKTSNIKTICKLVDVYEMDYPPEPYPFTLDMKIDIHDIVDLDWTENTITLFIQLWTFWDDPRLTIADYVDDIMKETSL